MFKGFKPVTKIQLTSDVTEMVTSLNDRSSLLEKLKSDRDQYEFTDIGAVLNPYRFLSLKSIFKGGNGALQFSKRLEADTPIERLYTRNF
jgi:hypothetical protein